VAAPSWSRHCLTSPGADKDLIPHLRLIVQVPLVDLLPLPLPLLVAPHPMPSP
jgi:hypothetical protein